MNWLVLVNAYWRVWGDLNSPSILPLTHVASSCSPMRNHSRATDLRRASTARALRTAVPQAMPARRSYFSSVSIAVAILYEFPSAVCGSVGRRAVASVKLPWCSLMRETR